MERRKKIQKVNLEPIVSPALQETPVTQQKRRRAPEPVSESLRYLPEVSIEPNLPQQDIWLVPVLPEAMVSTPAEVKPIVPGFFKLQGFQRR